MWRRKLSAVISKSRSSPRSCQLRRSDDADEDLVLRLGRRERAEVVLAERAVAAAARSRRRRAAAGTSSSRRGSNGERSRRLEMR